jgi:mannose-6-phosphate isomerase-like protein (cupin superfamily)
MRLSDDTFRVAVPELSSERLLHDHNGSETTVETSLTLCNHFNGETFVFSCGEERAGTCRFDVILDSGGTGGGNALAHVHPAASEKFEVKRGRLAVVMRGVEKILEAGQSAVIPAGTAHYFRNAHNGQTEATVEFAPAQHHVRFFKNFAILTETHPQWFSPKGDPSLLLIALVLHTYRNHLYLAGIPVLLQKVLFAMLSPIARIRGYRLAIDAPVNSRQNYETEISG